jgi:hypothetical protein
MIIPITFPSIIKATLSHKTHHDKVATNFLMWNATYHIPHILFSFIAWTFGLE